MQGRVQAQWEFVTARLSLIRALYIVSVATNGPREDIDAEFRQAIGDVLEGMALPMLNLTLIDKDKVREEAAWLRERS
jgi:hypothetical protein